MVSLSNNISAVEVYKIIRSVGLSHGDNQINDFVIGTAICLRESGGPPFISCNTVARNVNKDGSIDRGIWQINNKAHANVTDAQCDNPQQATEAAYTISGGFKDWSAWEQNGKLVLNSLPAAALAARSIGDIATANAGQVPDGAPPILSEIPVIGGAVNSAFNALTTIPDLLKQAFEMITNVSFWKKVLIGIFGVAVVIYSLTLIFPKTTNIATSVAETAAVV